MDTDQTRLAAYLLEDSTSVLAGIEIDVEKKRKRSQSASPASDTVDLHLQPSSDNFNSSQDVQPQRDQGTQSASIAEPFQYQQPRSLQQGSRKTKLQLQVDVPASSSLYVPNSVEPFWRNKVVPRNILVLKANDIVELRKIGAGSFSSVYLAEWLGTQVAIKVYHASQLEQLADDPQDVFREAIHSTRLNHPAIVKTYAIVKYPNTFGLLQELMSCTLRERLCQALSFPRQLPSILNQSKARVALQAAAALRELHSHGLIHFDFKCDNLLVDGSPLDRVNVKICDFGLTREEPREPSVGFSWLGTGPWMAPELRNPSSSETLGSVSRKVDVFSFGVVMWEIWNNGQPPRYLPMPADPWDYDEARPVPLENAPFEYSNLMERCWQTDADARPDMDTVVKELTSLYAKLRGLSVHVVDETAWHHPDE